jgi:hypothetical protein
MAEAKRDLIASANFPFRGIDRSREFHTQPQGTTPDGTNVRAFDRQARMRGGSRSGLSRYINESLGNSVQHLAVLVSTHADALGWSVGGRDFGFTGIYGGIGFFGLPAGSDEAFTPAGGSGYGASSRERYTLTLEVDDEEMPIDGSETTVTATLANEESGSPPPELHTIELRTLVNGRVGDRIQAQTNLAGIATFQVSNTREEMILYKARDITSRRRATNNVTVNYVDMITFVQSTSGGTFNAAAATTRSVSFLNDVTEGNLLVVVNAVGAEDVQVSDSRGNSWYAIVQVGGDPIRPRIWMARSKDSGPCTISYTPGATQQSSVCALEYSGAVTSIPPEFQETGTLSTSGNSDVASLTVPVHHARSLLIVGTASGLQGSTTPLMVYTPPAGYNVRASQSDTSQNNLNAFMVLDKLSVNAAEVTSIGLSVTRTWTISGVSIKKAGA